MTGLQLYTFLCDILLGGIQLNTVAFYQMLNFIKNALENERPFIALRAIQATQIWSTSDTYLTNPKTLPSDFRTPRREGLLKTLDSLGNQGPELKMITMESRLDYKDIPGYWYIDYANGVYYLTGTADKAYTIHFPYVMKSPDITATTSWIFPSEYHLMLVEILAAMHKNGIDFDDINSRMATQNSADYQRGRTALISWDTELQLAMLPR